MRTSHKSFLSVLFNVPKSGHAQWVHLPYLLVIICLFVFMLFFVYHLKPKTKKKTRKKNMLPRTWSIDPKKYVEKSDHFDWINQVMTWLLVKSQSQMTSTMKAWIQDLNMNIAAKESKFSAVIYGVKEEASLPSLVEIRSMKMVGNDIHSVVQIRTQDFGFLVSVQSSKSVHTAGNANGGSKEKRVSTNYSAEFQNFECWCSAVLTRMNGNIGLILKPNEKSPNVEIKMKSWSKKSNDDVKPEAVAQVIHNAVMETTFYANLSLLCERPVKVDNMTAVLTSPGPAASIEPDKSSVQRKGKIDVHRDRNRSEEKSQGARNKTSCHVTNQSMTSNSRHNPSDEPDKDADVHASSSSTTDATADYEDCCSIPGQDLDVFKRILERRSKFSDKAVLSAQSSSNQVSTDEKMLVIEDISFKPLKPGDYFPLICTLELDEPHQQKTRFLNADSVSGELNFSIDPRSSVVKVFLKNSRDSVDPIECGGSFMIDSVHIKQIIVSVPVKNSTNVGLVSLRKSQQVSLKPRSSSPLRSKSLSRHRSPPVRRPPAPPSPPVHRCQPQGPLSSDDDMKRRSPTMQNIYSKSRDFQTSHSYARNQETKMTDPLLPSSFGDYPPGVAPMGRKLMKELNEKWSDIESIKPSSKEESVIMTNDGIIVPKSNFSRSPEARRSNHVREKRNSDPLVRKTLQSEYEFSKSEERKSVSPDLEELIAKHRRLRQNQAERKFKRPQLSKSSMSSDPDRTGLFSFDDMDYDLIKADNAHYVDRPDISALVSTPHKTNVGIGRLRGMLGKKAGPSPPHRNMGLSRSTSFDDTSLSARENASVFRRIVSLRDKFCY